MFEDDLPPVAEEAPRWLLDVPAELLAQEDLEVEAWFAGLTPAERFEQEFGVPATPESLPVLTTPTQEEAAARQEVAVQANRVRTIADAHRIARLLEAHDASIQDLVERFGPTVGAAEGLGGRSFAATMGLLTGTDPRQITHEVHAGATLRDRLPLTWAAFQSGAASWSRAQKAVKQADGLDDEFWPAYDEKAAAIVVRSTRVKSDLRRTRERLQDGTAAKRARTTFERRRTSVELGADSGVAFVIEGLAVDWMPRNDALHRLAVAAHGVDPRHRSVAQLRHDLAGRIFDLGLEAFQRSAAEGGEVVPTHTKVDVRLILTVPALAWLGKTKEQAILQGYGPIDLETAKSLAGQARSMVRVLTDRVTGVRLTMDRKVYRPPADLARWVRIRDGRTRFPGKSTPAHLSDIDHAREWQDLGRTDDSNLVTLDRSSHNAKSAGLVQEDLRDDGVVGLTDAWRHYFEDPPNEPLDPAPPDLLRPAGPPGDEPCPF